MEHVRDEWRRPWSSDPLVSVVARFDGTRLALSVQGEADRGTARPLLAELLSALRPDLTFVGVDLTDLSFCDLSGSDALHAFADEAGSRGISVELHGMSALLSVIYRAFPSCHGGPATAMRPDLRGRVSRP